MRIPVFLLFLVTCPLPAQVLSGKAILSLEEGDPICLDSIATVRVMIDLRNVTSLGSAVGLNGFVLKITTNRPNDFSVARLGDSLIPSGWGFAASTQQVVVDDTLTLVGWALASSAPGGLLHVATLLFRGEAGPVFIEYETSGITLATPQTSGDLPVLIPFLLPGDPLVFNLPAGQGLNFLQGIALWQSSNATYDLVPSGTVDVLDYAILAECNTP